jgi:hypothetical protein
MAVALAGPHTPLGLQLLAYGAALFAGCMVCHGELYRLRPSPRHLSGFYLCVSVGGVLGGVFVSLLAPRLFRTFAEYPLALAACCLVALAVLLPRPEEEAAVRRLGRMMLLFLLAFAVAGTGVSMGDLRRELRLSARGFFGVVQVVEQGRSQPSEHRFMLKYGTTSHGVQFTEPGLRQRPMSYYTPESGLGLAVIEQRRLREAEGSSDLRVGVLGLGVGSIAALGREGDTVRFYEINPDIIALAQGEGGYFNYLRDAAARVEVVEGDARISLERELERGEPQGFDVLAVDVFTSDAIPVHLLTEEAVAVYRKHLAPHGVLALHISNSHLDLVPVTLSHARALGLHATYVVHEPKGRPDAAPSSWMLLSPEAGFFSGPAFAQAGVSARRMEREGVPLVRWTDERSSLLPVLQRRAQPPLEQARAAPSPTPVAAPAVP